MSRHSLSNLAQYKPKRRHRGRRDKAPTDRIRQLIGAYVVSVVVLLAAAAMSPVTALLAYPALGLWISRVSERRISWSHHHATIHNVAGAKVRMIALWPVALPTLILELWLAYL